MDILDNGNKYLIISNEKNVNNAYWSAIAHNERPNYSNTKYEYTTTNVGNLYIGYYLCTQNDLNTILQNTDVQIEEGHVITEYEPYYLTESTAVTQTQNHTLTAIWEKN